MKKDFLKELKDILNKDLKTGEVKEKTGKLPTKTTINLAMKEERAISGKRLATYVGIAVVVLLLIVKFGVIDQIGRLNDAENQYQTVHDQYTQTQDALEQYSQVEAEYRKYSRDWMNDPQSSDYIVVGRTKVLDVVEKDMKSVGNVKSVNVQGDMAVVEMSGMNLKQISDMFLVLNKESIVKSLELTIAQTEEKDTGAKLDFSVTIALQPDEGAQG